MPAEISAKKIPRATYRLQFNEHFRLADAVALVPYFHELGVSHLYASPLFQACAHSVHGYDVCDFSRLNPELGTEADLEKLVAALRQRGMGLVLDIVPNHMGIGTPENAWWWDVLKNGRASRFAHHFDIHWDCPDPKLRGKILAPVLGEDLGRVLEKGELKRDNGADGPVLRYFEHPFPIAPDTPRDVSLRELLDRQHYVLAPFSDGDAHLNYRRFFAVNTLAAVRVEEATVFDDVHSRLRRWIEKGWIDGLRVDHPDGLREPKKYLDRLRALAPDLWIIVEKILQPQEPVPDDWPVQGTVGYDFLNVANGLFIQTDNEKVLTDFYSQWTGEPVDSCRAVQEKKRLVLQTLFTTEINRLVELLVQIAARHPANGKFSPGQSREALVEFAASFPVYRSYVRPGDNVVGENDIRYVKEAAVKAKELRPDLPAELFEWLSGLLLLSFRGPLEDDFVLRFQQLTGPAMAKGVEDTAFYCLNRFASLNEVGGDPGKFGVSVETFHAFCQQQQARRPHSMLASSTHDTKRSEDVRARMNLLSAMPSPWIETVRRWSAMNERHRTNNFPDRNAEYLFYQTLVGAWPISLERILDYMEKASCEARQHTAWNRRNPEYDRVLKRFVEATLADKHFVADLEQFIAPLAEAARVNSLAQTLVKLTAPGVPDIYQGNELWDFSLVDPDNRRPVDFEPRRRLQAEIKSPLSIEEIWKRRDEGLPKLWLIQKTLGLRAANPAWFTGPYEPLFARGPQANHIVAFTRSDRIITIVPRFPLAPSLSPSDGARVSTMTDEGISALVDASKRKHRKVMAGLGSKAIHGQSGDQSMFPLPGGEGQGEGERERNKAMAGSNPKIIREQETTLKLPDGTWRNEFTGKNFAGAVSIRELFQMFPVALLVRKDGA